MIIELAKGYKVIQWQALLVVNKKARPYKWKDFWKDVKYLAMENSNGNKYIQVYKFPDNTLFELTGSFTKNDLQWPTMITDYSTLTEQGIAMIKSDPQWETWLHIVWWSMISWPWLKDYEASNPK